MVKHRLRRILGVWIIGIAVFILAMTITFADVYGLEYFNNPLPGNNPDADKQPRFEMSLNDWNENSNTNQGNFYDPTLPTSADIQAIPEPTSLTLLIFGCGIFLASRKKRNP